MEVANVSNSRKKIALTAVSIILRQYINMSQASISESEESLDEELNLVEKVSELKRKQRKRKADRRTVPKLLNYVEEIMPRMLDSDFKSHFRMHRKTFEYVLEIIAPKLERSYPGLGMISPEKQFLLCIWRMATPDSYRSICEKFSVSRSTALLAVRRVTKALIDLAPALIRWPTRNRAEKNWRGFEAISAFPKVLGAIDGTHIRIPAPRKNPEAYVNRKGFHSIQLQAICDHKTRFLHCVIGHVGSVHDQRVFRLSEIQQYLGNEEKFPVDCYILGDSAYKLHENLMVPYRDNGHLSERQKNFNFCHSSARMAIERAFGLLKGRFRSLLHLLPMTDTDQIPDFVLACCVLHNTCVMQDDHLSNAISIEHEETSSCSIVHENAIQNNVPNQVVANIKRDLICQKLILRNV